jgi:predicted MPP superfamily phosphohydrolase
MNRKRIGMTVMGIAGAVILAGLPYKIDIDTCEIHSSKIKHDVRVLVIADLHCREYGKGQKHLLAMVKRSRPDLIVIPGDLFDTGRKQEYSFELLEGLRDYPVFFTSGNHERFMKNEIDELRKQMKDAGVHVLEDCGETITVNGQRLEIAGMSDHGSTPIIQTDELNEYFKGEGYRILLSHRPNYIEFYNEAPCDLIVSGHVHGGQWRLPISHRGIASPEGHLFPKYSEGLHDLNGRNLYISRGLATGNPYIPRMYNNPCISLIKLKGM